LGKKSRLKKEIKQGSGRKSIGAAVAGRFPVWLLILIAAVAILIFVRSLPYAFVYDDELQVLENPWIRDWSQVLRFFSTHVWAFARTQTISNYYRPLHMVTYAVAYSIGGLKPHVFHLINILIHALCSVTVVLIGFRLSRNRYAGAAAGLLFALHPIHAESVTWISGITDPLCAAFYFPALYFYLKDSQEDGNRAALILALGCFLGALFSKEMAFTFPIIAGWLDWCLYRKFRWSRYAMFAALFAFYALMRIRALHAFFVQQIPLHLDPFSRILSTIVLLAQYVAKMFVPFHISAFHVFEPTTSILTLDFALSAVCLAAYAAASWFLRRQRTLLFLFGYCILTIIPALNLSGIGHNIFADRYLYIPTLGSCLLLPLLAQSLRELWPSRPQWLNPQAGVALLALVLSVFAWRLWNEIGVWRDVPTLFTETMRRSPGAAVIAHNLGRYYYYHGDLAQATHWETKALEVSGKSFLVNRPNNAAIFGGLGSIAFDQDRRDEALGYYLEASKEMPSDEDVLRNLATVYISLQDYRKALPCLQALVRANPRNEIAYSDLSALYLTIGQYDLAIANARSSLGINPNYGDACLNLARAYGAKGMKEEAREAYLQLKRIAPEKSAQADAGLKALSSR
jgi:tetratricopeptide (TPR) repeat protein